MATLHLAPVLDLAAASPLRVLLLAHRGQDLALDAGAVIRVGAPCLQVLLAAKRTWQTDGRQIQLRNVPDTCRDTLAIIGASSLLGIEG